MRVDAGWRMRQFFLSGNFLRELAIFTVAFQRRFAHKSAALDAELFLRDRKRVRATDFCHLHAFNRFPVSDDKIRMRRRSQKVAVEAGLLGDAWSFLQRATSIRQSVELRHFSPIT